MTALEIEGLRQVVAGRTVLRDVNLVVEEGAALGLVGPNGSGKSTLLRVAATLLRPTAGTVRVLGLDVRSRATGVRRAIGYVPESGGVYPSLTVAEHLDLFARCHRVPAGERGATVETLLRVVDLYPHRREEAARLSRGLRRRLLLAQALVHSPTLLLLDEPLAGVDGVGQLELVEVLRELNQMGTTLVVASNALDDLHRFCTTIAELRDGRLVRVGAPEELLGGAGPAARRIRAELLDGLDEALRVLASIPEVREVESHDHTITFRLEGDRALQSAVLGRLVAAGLPVAGFGTEGGALAEEWAQAMREHREAAD